MIEDRILVWKFNRHSKDALQRIYEKYKSDLLGLARALLTDKNAAEDVLHDVFVTFARSSGKFRLSGSLKGYLLTCTANRARDRNRSKQFDQVQAAEQISSNCDGPHQTLIANEQKKHIAALLSRLPYDQREVIVLHLHHGLRFREIAKACNVSTNTAQSRYRYGIEKLRSLLNGEVTK
jgi:RNA polymerase sigma-70 factor (ECF subfamily)